ncbi:hypothetical protein BDV36DRAFT_110839 [Aspergillus pseudocaelatus]|uniref:Uncharacterized protein n=1 Tax=Aspergillus pseudocaelatus TaxID=1825620 RepID=A0ABQ6W0V7_9EURO|nr:hypothetical protein BDV36DRAFT_110839 [Aspergillus pseudocaelatus]
MEKLIECISVNHLRSGFATVERDLVVGVGHYSILRILCGEILERVMTFSFTFSFKVPFPTLGRLALNASAKLSYSFTVEILHGTDSCLPPHGTISSYSRTPLSCFFFSQIQCVECLKLLILRSDSSFYCSRGRSMTRLFHMGFLSRSISDVGGIIWM